MIAGTVTAAREARIPLHIRNPGGVDVGTEAVIDTGFTDYLGLPGELIATFSPPLAGTTRVTLADGTEAQVPVYLLEVSWDDQLRTISVLALEGGPLVGMSLLYGYELRMQVIDGGLVAVERLQ